MNKYDPKAIAIWIASDPEYQRDENADVAIWVDSWTAGERLNHDDFAALLDEVLSELRFAKPEPKQTAEWRRASHDYRAECRAEQRAFSSDF